MDEDMGIPCATILRIIFLGGGAAAGQHGLGTVLVLVFPVFVGRYSLVRPNYAEDVSHSAVEAGSGTDSLVADAAWPGTFTLGEQVWRRALDSGCCVLRLRWSLP